MRHRTRMRTWLFLATVTALLPACAVSEEVRSGSDPIANEPGSLITQDAATVASVQLHAGSGENALPILHLGRGMPLRLAFDVLSRSTRPLTITFYHADRTWKRDLMPAEYMARFQRDDILDYRPSRATRVDYVHYEYTFPNNSIDFRLSGNYILRVHEQGREEAVLFERPFFVSEQATPLDMRWTTQWSQDGEFASLQPVVRFSPQELSANAFDYAVCFMRDAHYDAMRCAERPSLEVSPDLMFYLEPRQSFTPQAIPFYINTADLRPGGRIERVDRQSSPWRVWLEPDVAELGGSSVDPFPNGQARIQGAVGVRGEANHEAEYVSVRLRLVPPGNRPVPGAVGVVGTFSDWQLTEANTLSWSAQEGWYEGDVLMKQGEHAYRYVSTNTGLQRSLETGMPQLQSLITTLVYYTDIRTQSDRLVAVQGVISR